MKELINHFVFDTVSLQIVAIVLLGFWIARRRMPLTMLSPKGYAEESCWLTVPLFVLVGAMSAYYGAPLGMIGKVGIWALHVGVLAFLRYQFMQKRSYSFRSFWDEAARFEALASLGVLFLKQ